MSFWNGVTPQLVSNAPDGFKEFKVGENEAWVQQVQETVAQKSGNSMLVITFRNIEGAEIKYYIVDDEYKMQKLKQFYLSFGIPMGSTEVEDWRGKTGIVVCKRGEPYDGKVYNKVSYLLPKTNGEKLSGYTVPQKPIPINDEFINDIPF